MYDMIGRMCIYPPIDRYILIDTLYTYISTYDMIDSYI